MQEEFSFYKDFFQCDDEICIKVHGTHQSNMAKYHVPTYNLSILRKFDMIKIGIISFKVGYNQNIYYAGNIGYEINPEFRGKHYAYKACLLILELAKYHNIDSVIITCAPDNYSSIRTCELLNAKEIEIVTAPIDSEAYTLGLHTKIRYKVSVN